MDMLWQNVFVNVSHISITANNYDDDYNNSFAYDMFYLCWIILL